MRSDGLRGPQTFRTVEAGRGLAALLVVLFHAGAAIFAAPKYWNTHVFGRAFDWGYAGVFFFFVLSGFIIVHVHAGDLGQPGRLRRYLTKRAVRIYPLYWLVLAGILALGAAGVGELPAPVDIVSSILLAGPDNKATVVAVAWTLYHEILFYAVCAAWIANARLGLAITLLWGVLIAAGLMLRLPIPNYVCAPVNLLFGYGVLTWRLSQVRIPAAAMLAVLAATAFVAVGADAVWWQRLSEPLHEQLFGLSAAIGLAATVSIERRRTVAVPRPLLLLGAASYSIYLIHFPLLSLLAKLSVRSGIVGRVPAEVAFAGVVAVTVAVGIAVHKLVERPLLAAINTRAFARRD